MTYTESEEKNENESNAYISYCVIRVEEIAIELFEFTSSVRLY